MSEQPPTPNLPVRADTLGDDAWTSYRHGRRFGSRDLPLSELGGGRQIGLSLTVLEPGAQSCPFHAHEREEEHFYVLAGRCVLRSGDARHEMGAGDYVCFPAGTGVAHALENPFQQPCRYLTIGNRLPDEVCVYPDSGKLLVRTARTRIMTALPSESLDYWHGEPSDEPLEGSE